MDQPGHTQTTTLVGCPAPDARHPHTQFLTFWAAAITFRGAPTPQKPIFSPHISLLHVLPTPTCLTENPKVPGWILSHPPSALPLCRPQALRILSPEPHNSLPPPLRLGHPVSTHTGLLEPPTHRTGVFSSPPPTQRACGIPRARPDGLPPRFLRGGSAGWRRGAQRGAPNSSHRGEESAWGGPQRQ